MKKGFRTILEITNTHVKLLRAKAQRGLFVVSSCQIRDLENNKGAIVEKALAEMVSQNKIEEDELIVIVPRRNIILKQISLPSHTEAELRKMIGLQLVNQVPYAREDIVFDFSVLGKDPSGYAKILVVVAHKDIINKYLKMFNEIDLVPYQLTLSSSGISNWYTEKEARVSSGDSTILSLINIDHSHSEVCFCRKGQLLFSRSINFGIRDLQPENMAAFMEQISLTFGAYKKEQMGEDIDKIIVISRSREASALKEELEKYYPKPIEILTSLSDIPCETSFDLSSFRAEEGISLISSLGFLFDNLQEQINLMPMEMLTVKRQRIKRRAIFQVIFLAILVIVFIIGAFGVGVYQDADYLKKIEKQIEGTKAEVKKAERKTQFLRFVKDNLQNRALIADVIKELYDLAPEEISFRSLNVDVKGVLTIQGFADKGVRVNQFQEALVGSVLFQEVNLKYATKRKRFKKEYIDFQIICKLGPGLQ